MEVGVVSQAPALIIGGSPCVAPHGADRCGMTMPNFQRCQQHRREVRLHQRVIDEAVWAWEVLGKKGIGNAAGGTALMRAAVTGGFVGIADATELAGQLVE